MRRLITLALIVYLLCPAGCSTHAPSPQPSAAAPNVRVRLLDNQAGVTVVSNGAAVQLGTRPLGAVFPVAVASSVKLSDAGWLVNDRVVGTGELIVQPSSIGSVSVNGAAYRGFYRFVPTGPRSFDVVNEVNIDDYLRGVVAKEMLPDWHAEAYAAQAIVARTYALFEAKSNVANKYWDLLPDQRSQVYGGLAGETDKAKRAVDSTQGVVVVFGQPGQEKIFKSYFSACCGGIGQNPADAFGEPFHPAMAGQNVGTLCSPSPRYNWGPIAVSKVELTRRLKQFGKTRQRAEQNLTRVMRIDKQLQNQAGRPVRYLISDASGARYSLSGEELRWAVNTDAPKDSVLWSSHIEPADAGDAIRFTGKGFGHGVGMCQWCAQVRATQGVAHQDIVLLSYPGSKLANAY